MHLLACQPTPVCISSCSCLFFSNWVKPLITKPQNMIRISKWQNATWQTRKTLRREVTKNVNNHMRNNRKPSRTASVTSSRLLLLHTKTCPRSTCKQARATSQKNARALKMHSPQPGCYGHVIGEIQLVYIRYKFSHYLFLTTLSVLLKILSNGRRK